MAAGEEDPEAAIAKLELEEKKLDDQTRDRIWVFSNPTEFRSEVGRFSDKPIVSEDVQTLRQLYVRRHIICLRFRPGLRETLLTSLVDIKRQLCGIASADVRLSFV